MHFLGTGRSIVCESSATRESEASESVRKRAAPGCKNKAAGIACWTQHRRACRKELQTQLRDKQPKDRNRRKRNWFAFPFIFVSNLRHFLTFFRIV